MLSLQNAGKRFGPRVLFLEANWLIRNDEKTALVGANGTGKSTLMKVLAGLETLDYGALEQTRGMSIGYLPQEGLELAGRTVFEECLTVFDELREMEREIERLAAQLAELDHESPEYDSAAERYSLLQDRFHALDGYALDAQVGGVLTGLGFGKEDWARQTDEFSGGWQMRIALAKLLLAKPNLLLLDEPTNHLDLETRNWLEDYLHHYPFGYILISHDRYFLDVTIDRTVEIWNKRLTIYQGNYTKYLSQKDERREQLMAAYRNQREQIEHLEAFINRFRYQATKAKQVQSRIKELEKIERIEIPEEEPVIHFKFPQPPPSGRMVVEAEGLAKSYGAEACVQQRALHHRARRPRGAGRRQRRGQIHAHQAAHRRGGAHGRLHPPGPQRRRRVLRAGPVQSSRPRGAHARRHQPRRAPSARGPTALAAGLLSLFGRRCLQAARRALGRRAQPLRAGADSCLALELPAPRRADQPSRHARQRCVARRARRLHRHRRLRLPRPLLHRSPGHARARNREWRRHSYEGNYEDYLRRKEALATEASSSTVILSDAARSAAEPKDLRLPLTSRGENAGHTPTASSNNRILIEGGYDAPESAAPKKQARRLNPIKQKQMEDRCAFLEEEIPRIEASIAHTEQQLGVYVSAAETQRLTTLAEELRVQLAALTAEWEELMEQL